MSLHPFIKATSASLNAFNKALETPQTSQENILARIVENNRDTAFGQHYGFAAIKNYSAFANRVPISRYADYQATIERLATGENGLLSAAPVKLFEETGGSTSGTKLIPYTHELISAFQQAILPWLGDLIRHRPHAFQGQFFFIISPLIRQHHLTHGGVPIGSGDDLAYLGKDMGQLMASRTLFLPELRNEQSAQEWQWYCARLLLSCPQISLISAWSPTLLLAIFRTIQQKQDSLIASFKDKQERSRLSKSLSGDRINTQALWPALDTISCWQSHTSTAPAKALQLQLPHAYIQGKGLLATEGVTTIPFGNNPYPVLTINSHFYEFIDAQNNLFLPHQLRTGEVYRVILTTQGGLYRYDTGDIVRVCDFTGEVPRLAFMGREDLISDICGEKLNEAFVLQAMQHIDQKLCDYCLLQGFNVNKPHYCLITTQAHDQWLTNDLLIALDQALRVNPQYDYARRTGQLEAPHIHWVEDLAEYANRFASEKQRLGTRKIPLLLPVSK